MKKPGIKTCIAMVLALGLLSACSSHCTCPPPAQPGSTTIIEPPSH